MTSTSDSRNSPIKVDNLNNAIELCYKSGWTDGLPVIPPAIELVDAMLDEVKLDPFETIAEHITTQKKCSAHAAATNAVMAGCLPSHFPVVIAALRAMSKPDFNYHGSTASTGGSAHMIIVSGPIVDQLEMNSSGNLFGSGNRANASIGRAIRLIHMNVFHMEPNITDRSTQGNPGKYSLCIAERAEKSPWPSLNEHFGYSDDSIVVVFAAGGFHNIENHFAATPEEALLTVADSMSCLDSLTHGQSVVVLSPETAEIIGSDKNWTREKVQEYLFNNAWRSVEDLERIGRPPMDQTIQAPEQSENYSPGETQFEIDQQIIRKTDPKQYHRGIAPEDILLLVGGGDAGAHSSFLPSWSRARNSLMQIEVI